jgi:hypothetical protein
MCYAAVYGMIVMVFKIAAFRGDFRDPPRDAKKSTVHGLERVRHRESLAKQIRTQKGEANIWKNFPVSASVPLDLEINRGPGPSWISERVRTGRTGRREKKDKA